jgi:hypothetical protein
MAQLNVTELDFDNIKANLKTFLNSQTEFSDYNFEGSGLSVLIDLLAYNTHYNGMLAHMLANENFIDTAIKRESVVSIAKALGYTPRSKRCPAAAINLAVQVPSSYTATTLVLSRDAVFSSAVDGTSYKFYPTGTTTTQAVTVGGAGPYFLHGTHTTLGKGFYYPLYLTETASDAVDTSGTGSTTYTFTEYSGVSFYSPNSGKKEAQTSLGTQTSTGENITISSGLTYGMYTGQVASSATATQFVFPGLNIKEGIRVSNQFVVSTGKEAGPYVLPNDRADTTTLRVRVQNSSTDLTTTTYKLNVTFLNVKSDTKAYFVEEGADGLFQIRFGDDIIGKKLSPGNIVIIDYINTNGFGANTAKAFAAGTTIATSGETVNNTTLSAAAGGSNHEAIDEIRYNAPRFNATRDRAVTEQDYETLILASNPNIQSCSVWGGEKNDPPIYGKVFVSLNPVAGTFITESDKDNIKTAVIEPKTPVSIIPEFVDPEYTYVSLDVGVVYNPKTTLLVKGQIESEVLLNINSYFTNSLNKLNKSFYYSRLHDKIKTSSDSIISVNIQTRFQKRVKPDLGVAKNYTIKFNQKIQPRELTSTYFDLTIADVTTKVLLQDVPAPGVVAPLYSGSGTVNAVTLSGTVIAAIGTLDYDSGTVTIPSTIINKLYGTETTLRMQVTPHDSVKDITTQALIRTSDTSTAAVVAKPSRNTVLTLDDSVVNSQINSRAGTVISATPEVEEI